MKRFIGILLTAGLLVVLLAACKGVPEGTPLEGAESDAVLAFSEPLADKALQSISANDYAAFSENLSEDMLAAMPQKEFDKLLAQLEGGMGEYQSRTIDRVVDYGDFLTVFYQTQFSKRAGKMSMSFSKTEPHQIRGMFFQ